MNVLSPFYSISYNFLFLQVLISFANFPSLFLMGSYCLQMFL